MSASKRCIGNILIQILLESPHITRSPMMELRRVSFSPSLVCSGSQVDAAKQITLSEVDAIFYAHRWKKLGRSSGPFVHIFPVPNEMKRADSATPPPFVVRIKLLSIVAPQKRGWKHSKQKWLEDFDPIPFWNHTTRINAKVHHWVKALITRRTCRVTMGDRRFAKPHFVSSLPRGSILGPPLLLLFINI